MEEKDRIEFFAKVKEWVCIKRGEVKEDTSPIEITRVLTSIQNSIDRKKWDFLSKELDLGKLDAIADELVGAQKGRVGEAFVSEVLSKVNGPGVGKKINEITELKSGKELAKTYLTRQVFEKLNFRVDLESKLVEKFLDEVQKSKMSK